MLVAALLHVIWLWLSDCEQTTVALHEWRHCLWFLKPCFSSLLCSVITPCKYTKWGSGSVSLRVREYSHGLVNWDLGIGYSRYLSVLPPSSVILAVSSGSCPGIMNSLDPNVDSQWWVLRCLTDCAKDILIIVIESWRNTGCVLIKTSKTTSILHACA